MDVHPRGVYADLDTICHKPVKPLLMWKNTAYVPVQSFELGWNWGSDAASPAFLASTGTGNPFWLLMLRYVLEFGHLPVREATGPIALANVVLAVSALQGNQQLPSRRPTVNLFWSY